LKIESAVANESDAQMYEGDLYYMISSLAQKLDDIASESSQKRPPPTPPTPTPTKKISAPKSPPPPPPTHTPHKEIHHANEAASTFDSKTFVCSCHL